MKKTLIAYGTRYGATAEVSEEIGKILREEFNLEVEIVNLKERKIKTLSDYANIVIGSGIKMGKWTSSAKRFLKKDFEGKKLAVFVCSRRAGNEETYETAYEKYVKNVIQKHCKIQPVAAEAFGGRKPLRRGEYLENRNWDKIRAWARKIGEIFSS